MRVAHIVGDFSSLTETFIYDTIIESARQGIDAGVITNARLNVKDRPFDPVYVVQPQPKWHPQRIGSRIRTALKLQQLDEYTVSIFFDGYRKLIKSLGPDIIHAHFGNIGWHILSVAEALKIPLVVSFHGYDAFLIPNQVDWMKRYSALFAYAKSINVVSQHMKNHLISIGAPPQKIKVIHVGKKLDSYQMKSVSLPVRNWLSIGRLVEKKGHDDCIQAFARLNDLPNVRLTIVGDGPMRSQLQQMIVDYGVSDKVRMIYEQRHEDVKDLLLKSDAFILCSKTAENGDSEGIPTVLMEAQAMGIPCVSTKHSGIPEVIPEDNHWLLADEGDVVEIEKLIRMVIALNALTLSNIIRKGRSKIEADFDIKKVTEAMVLTYNDV